jgi:hypothetical protein
MAATDKHATTGGLMRAVFSEESAGRSYNDDQLSLPVRHERVCISQLIVGEDEAADNWGTKRKGSVRQRRPLLSNGVKTVTENPGLCVAAICNMRSRVI